MHPAYYGLAALLTPLVLSFMSVCPAIAIKLGSMTGSTLDASKPRDL